jgi:quercetin dioxygenase-like cupin family protein
VTVFFEPSENHWHGATPERFMRHLAIRQADDSGSFATWGEQVSDAQYGRGPDTP